ncbi:MAG: cbb3-type cytochrome oxidase assembly protein CcoS [Saprospiraceae bacterium]
MKVIVLLLIVSLSVSLLFLLFYILGSQSGQFDDTFSPGHRILFKDSKKEDN